MSRRYIIVVDDSPEDGGYVASVPSVPGVYGQGETEEEAFQDAKAALAFTLDDMTESGEELPPSDGHPREVELAI
jgi:predicted RNase H-like HicB family nuclease